MTKSKFNICHKKLGGAAAGLILMIFFGIPAAGQEGQGEFGINGMAAVSKYGLYVLPGGVINVGYLKKGIGAEGYLAFFPEAGLLGFLIGGNIVANPFSAGPISPCLSAGILVSPAGLGFGIWNAGGGLKIKFARNMGIRMEYRYCRAFGFSSGFQFGFGMLVGGIFFHS